MAHVLLLRELIDYVPSKHHFSVPLMGEYMYNITQSIILQEQKN